MKKPIWRLIDPEKAHWQIEAAKDLPSFLRAVPIISPPWGIIYFEDGGGSKEIDLFFHGNSISESVIPMGSADPDRVYHLPISNEKMEKLAQIAERHSEIEIAAHIHIYRRNQIILQWYDAFEDPLVISKKIPEEKIKRFCKRLSLRYKELGNVSKALQPRRS